MDSPRFAVTTLRHRMARNKELLRPSTWDHDVRKTVIETTEMPVERRTF